MFYVKNWDTQKVEAKFSDLAGAKKFCKNLGHTGEFHSGSTGYPPVAFVSNEKGECVYNPRFAYKNQ